MPNDMAERLRRMRLMGGGGVIQPSHEGLDDQAIAPPEGTPTNRVWGAGGTVHWGSASGPSVTSAMQYGQFTGPDGQVWEHLPVPGAPGVTWAQPVMSANQRVLQDMSGNPGITAAGARGLRGALGQQDAEQAPVALDIAQQQRGSNPLDDYVPTATKNDPEHKDWGDKQEARLNEFNANVGRDLSGSSSKFTGGPVQGTMTPAQIKNRAEWLEQMRKFHGGV